VSLSLEKVFLQICVLFRFIPERFTLVKLEGYAVFMGPELFIASPGFPARLPLVEIGQNFPVEIGHFIDFKLFFLDSPHPTTCLGWKSTIRIFS
jgi:hypothetical protein